MRKNVAKIVVILVLAIILIGLCFMFVGCDKEETWEILYFDDDWELLENYGLKPYNSASHNWKVCNFTYDGKIKGFNAKAYKNGKEIYKFDYKDPICYLDKVLKISICKPGKLMYEECTSIDDMPKEKGEYYMQLVFYDAYKDNQFTNLERCFESLKFNII